MTDQTGVISLLDYLKPKPFWQRFVETVRPIEKIEPEETDWMVDHLLARGHVTLLTGAPGVAKTTFAAALCAQLTGETKHKIEGNIVYFGPEVNFGQQVRNNYQYRGGGMSERLWCTEMDGDLVDLSSELHRIQRHANVELVIVDTFITFSGDYDTNKASDVRKLLLPLRIAARKLNVAVMVLGHNKKGTEGKSWEDTAGSHQITGQVGIQAALYRPDVEERKELMLIIHKSNLGPDYLDMPVRVKNIDPENWKNGITVQFPEGFVFNGHRTR